MGKPWKMCWLLNTIGLPTSWINLQPLFGRKRRSLRTQRREEGLLPLSEHPHQLERGLRWILKWSSLRHARHLLCQHSRGLHRDLPVPGVQIRRLAERNGLLVRKRGTFCGRHQASRRMQHTLSRRCPPDVWRRRKNEHIWHALRKLSSNYNYNYNNYHYNYNHNHNHRWEINF